MELIIPDDLWNDVNVFANTHNGYRGILRRVVQIKKILRIN